MIPLSVSLRVFEFKMITVRVIMILLSVFIRKKYADRNNVLVRNIGTLSSKSKHE